MYTHTGILFSLEKQGRLTICDNMDESAVRLLSAISQIQRQIPHDLIYTWNLA